MSDITALVKNYIGVWNIADPAARRAAIDEVFTEDVEYTDPNIEAKGREALDAYIETTRRQLNGLVFSLAGDVSTHHGLARFTWHVGPEGAANPTVVGYDFAVTENGRVKRLYGFFS